jgi:hypothetical protein
MGWHWSRDDGTTGDGEATAAGGDVRSTGPDAGFWASPVGQAAEARLRGDHFFQIELGDSAIASYAGSATSAGGHSARHAWDLLGQIEELGWHLEHVAWWRVDGVPGGSVAESFPDSATTGSLDLRPDHVRGVYLFHAVDEAVPADATPPVAAPRAAAGHVPSHRRDVG